MYICMHAQRPGWLFVRICTCTQKGFGQSWIEPSSKLTTGIEVQIKSLLQNPCSLVCMHGGLWLSAVLELSRNTFH